MVLLQVEEFCRREDHHLVTKLFRNEELVDPHLQGKHIGLIVSDDHNDPYKSCLSGGILHRLDKKESHSDL